MVTRPKLRLARYLVPVIIVLAIIFSIRQCGNQEKPSGHPRDYAAIANEGILRVATEYNSISFYVDGDTVSGFHYELIQAFAHDKGLKTEDSLLLTSPITLNKQVLVQRKENGENDSLHIRSQLDLAGRTLHVVKGSPSILRIQNLGNEIGDTIYIKEIEKYGSEQLISMVAHGDIDYAVCDESIARAAADSIPQIDINTAISFTQFYSWAVSKQSPALLDSLNAWLDKFQKEKEYQKIYKKYYDKE